MEYTLFIYHRDFRIVDNIGLNYAMQNCNNVLPIFIFTNEQINDNNKFKSSNSIQFMVESLDNLDKTLKKHNSKMHYFYGNYIEILEEITNTINVNNIIFNIDYTPYAKKRTEKVEKFCEENKINCITQEDYLLAPIGSFLKSDGDPYTIYTPFKNHVLSLKNLINNPKRIAPKNLSKTNKLNTISLDVIDEYYEQNENILVHGGRNNSKKIIRNLKNFNDYQDTRNMLSENTTHLSAYIKYGCLSIREVFYILLNLYNINHGLIAQLIWREFYFYIANYFPDVLKGKNYNKKYDKIKWNNSNKLYNLWIQGRTGYPIVDAAMVQINTQGYMHNRGRLITSNFLNRLLGYHWTKGEKYFANKLVDYDPSVNNGNWQWIASTGVDPKPFNQRLFNPWLQSKRFDSDAEYIKRWLPQLKDIPANHLHEWDKHCDKYDLDEIDYVEPCVDYSKARAKSLQIYKSV